MSAIGRLRTIAEQASEGPWSASGYDDAPTVYGAAYRGTWVVADVRDGGLNDETFIATFDPPTVLALLDVAEAAEHVAAPGFDIANNAALDASLDRLREVSS